MKIAISIAKFIILIAILVGLIGVAMYFSGYTMYAKIDGDVVMDSASGYTVASGKPLTVDLGYTFDFGGEKDMSGYSVMVVPNTIAGKDFTYKIGESEYSYQAVQDLTKGFNIVCEDNSFTIEPKGCLATILSYVHYEELQADGESLTHSHTNDYDNMYSLVIHSNDGEASIKIHFSNEDDNHGKEGENSDNSGENNLEPPTAIYVDTADNTTNESGMVVLHPNSTYSFQIKTENSLGTVSNDDCEYGYSTFANGTVILGNCEFFMGTLEYTWDDSSLKTVDYSSLVDDFVEISIEGKYINITTKEPIEKYYLSNSSTDGTHIDFVEKFYSYGSDCFIKIAIRDMDNNLETVFGITIVNKEG